MTTARSHFMRLAPLVVMILAAVVLYLDGALQPPQSTPMAVDCADLRSTCRALLDGQEVTLGVEGELKVLEPFQVWVKASGVRQVKASFDMQGMDMGTSLYTLRADEAGVFRGRVTLPTCVSGTREWVMTLDIDGTRLAVPFVTEL